MTVSREVYDEKNYRLYLQPSNHKYSSRRASPPTSPSNSSSSSSNIRLAYSDRLKPNCAMGRGADPAPPMSPAQQVARAIVRKYRRRQRRREFQRLRRVVPAVAYDEKASQVS